MDYEWAVGTTPGGQDVTTFSSDGIFHVEEQTIAGDGNFLVKDSMKSIKVL